MIKSASQKVPKFSTLDELVAFFDTHDMGEDWEGLPEAEFDVDIQRRTHIFSWTKTWLTGWRRYRRRSMCQPNG